MPSVVYKLQDHEPPDDDDLTPLACPKCDGINRVLTRETATSYSSTTCRLCNGVGTVSYEVRVRHVEEQKAKLRRTQTPISGIRVKLGRDD